MKVIQNSQYIEVLSAASFKGGLLQIDCPKNGQKLNVKRPLHGRKV